jgi:aromatic ring hydroxylase
MIETLQILGAGGLLMIPTEKDLDGPIASDVEKYYQGAEVTARERIKLFKLAWDASGEAFGQRQVQYERYFNGDPVRVIARHYLTYDKSRAIGMVKRFLSETP